MSSPSSTAESSSEKAKSSLVREITYRVRFFPILYRRSSVESHNFYLVSGDLQTRNLESIESMNKAILRYRNYSPVEKGGFLRFVLKRASYGACSSKWFNNQRKNGH